MIVSLVGGCGDDDAAVPDASGRDAAVLDASRDAAGPLDGASAIDAGATSVDGGGAADDAGATPVDGGSAPLDAGPTPTAPWITFLGGADFEQARDVAVDSAGNVIVVGGTQSADYPTTPGAYDTTFHAGPGGMLGGAGRMDVFVTKLSPDGRLLWSTFVGGPSYDRAYGVEVDAAGDVYIAGRAGEGFPTTAGVLQSTFAGDMDTNALYGPQDGFIAKLSADGARLLWSTYFGGTSRDFIRDLDIDASGNVYVGVGELRRTHPHVTAGAFRTTRPGMDDNVFAKIAAGGTSVIWATYLGGSGVDSVPSVRVAADLSLVVTTSTESGDLPVTPMAYQSMRRGTDDLYIARIASDGASLIFCTYFGGTGAELTETHNLVLTPTGDVVVGSETTSGDLPTTPGALRSTRAGMFDSFVAVLSSDGRTLRAATYIGGTGSNGLQGLSVHAPSGDIFTGGTASSGGGPVSASAYQSTHGGGSSDAWFARLTSDLGTARYYSYAGGPGDDQQRSSWIDASGAIFSVGQAATGFPTTPGAYDTTYGGGSHDAWVGRFPTL